MAERLVRRKDSSSGCAGSETGPAYAVLSGAVALQTLTLKLARPANRSSLFTGALFRRLLIVTTQLHFAVDAFTLQLLLQRTKGLINVVVANHDLHKTVKPHFNLEGVPQTTDRAFRINKKRRHVHSRQARIARPLAKHARVNKRGRAFDILVYHTMLRRAIGIRRKPVYSPPMSSPPYMSAPSFFTASLYVAIGGGIGSWLRFLIGRFYVHVLGPISASAFPWSTLTVNVAGSFAMGLLVGGLAPNGAESGIASESLRLFVAVGVLGGFTTFSAFSLEVVSIIERGQTMQALGYIGVSLLAGLGALACGLLLMRSPT